MYTQWLRRACGNAEVEELLSLLRPPCCMQRTVHTLVGGGTSTSTHTTTHTTTIVATFASRCLFQRTKFVFSRIPRFQLR